MFQRPTEQCITSTWTNIGIPRVKNAGPIEKREIARKHNCGTHSLSIFIFLHYKFRGFCIGDYSQVRYKGVQIFIGLKFPRNDVPVQNDPSRAQNLQTRRQDCRLVQRPWQNFHCRPTCSTVGRTRTPVRNNWRKSEPLKAPTKFDLPNIFRPVGHYFSSYFEKKCSKSNLLSTKE